MTGTTHDGIRNASEPPVRHGITCATCGTFTLTAIKGLFSNPRVGSPQRFCSPACRAAAWRRRQAAVPEDTPRQRTGGRSRRLRPDPLQPETSRSTNKEAV
jgi:hypothetical protein